VHAWLSRLCRTRPDPLTVDRTLAVLLTVGAEGAIWLGDDAPHQTIVAALVAPVVTASVAVRRRYPTLVGTGVPLFAALNFALWHGPQFVGYPIANFCALYALAVWTPPRRFAFGLALVLAGFLATSASPDVRLDVAIGFTVVTAVVLLLVRRIVHDRERRALIAERERDEAAHDAIVEERARIARELHDVIAHHVSMIVVQAGAERRALGDDDASTRQTLLAVEAMGRSALNEMRRVLGGLRSDAPATTAPQPGLDDVPTLVGQLRQAGLPVELRIGGEPRELPIAVDLLAYQIVQEALTNALEHSGRPRASVRILYGDTTLALEIADNGTGGSTPAFGDGLGLSGMRGRVALHNCDLQTRLNASGAFAVSVVLPIPARVARPIPRS